MTILSSQEKKKLRRQLISSYFFFLYINIIEGANDKDLNISLHFFEELELYEECLGIHLAREYANFFIFTTLLNNYYDFEPDTRIRPRPNRIGFNNQK